MNLRTAVIRSAVQSRVLGFAVAERPFRRAPRLRSARDAWAWARSRSVRRLGAASAGQATKGGPSSGIVGAYKTVVMPSGGVGDEVPVQFLCEGLDLAGQLGVGFEL